MVTRDAPCQSSHTRQVIILASVFLAIEVQFAKFDATKLTRYTVCTALTSCRLVDSGIRALLDELYRYPTKLPYNCESTMDVAQRMHNYAHMDLVYLYTHATI